MNPRPANDLDAIVEQLSRLDAGEPSDASIADAPSTVWGLKAELDTLIDQLREPADADPFADESGLRRAQELVLAIGLEPKSKTHGERLGPGRIGPYELLEKLGEGGMGAVYKAMHSSLEKIVALKVLPPDRLDSQAISRFKGEMKAVGKLDHPNIIRATDAGEANGEHFLVMEYVDGVDLSELLRRVGPLAAADACELVRQVAVGLQHAHRRGLVHRDIKPSNIMFAFDDGHSPSVKILDMGLALLSEPGIPARNDLTTTGQMMGSLEYMSPEQSQDTHRVDIRTDIYSLGATLYKLLCGKAPFSSERFNTPGKLVVALATETPPSIGERRSDLPTGLVAFVERMLARTPAERPATPAEVAQALTPFSVGADLMQLANRARQLGTPSNNTADQLVTRTGHQFSSPGTGTKPIFVPEFPAKDLHTPAASAKDLAKTPSVSRDFSVRKLNPPPLALVGLITLLSGAILFGGQIVRLVTNQGTIVIETDGAGISVVLKDLQGQVLIDGETKREITFQAGEYSIEVTVRDSSGEQRFITDHFTLARNGKKIVDARWEATQPLPETPTAPDRRAAEYVLSIGGTIGFMENGKERSITAVADLPQGPFELTVLSLNWNPKASDAGLASCMGCKNIAVLNLDGTQVSDAGLINFKDCNNLTHLGLHGTQVTDAGLAQFKGSTNLTHFDVGGTSVSDAGLANFKDCRNLTILDASCTQLTDVGLACFKDCKHLTTLRVGGLGVTDSGLAYFKDCQDLTTLALDGPQIGDAGLANFKDCKKIVGLTLNCAKMTEAGLLTFKDCRIGGLYLAESQATDAWLVHFKDWKTTLGQLLLGGTQVTDAGLAHLKDCDLYVLQITDTRVSDAGLVHLQGFKHLGALDLTGMQVSDAGLKHLAKIQSLGAVELRGTKVTAAGVTKLQAALPTCKIVSDFELSTDPDRRAAEYVLSIGGYVSFNGIKQSIGAIEDLPRGAFELTGVLLESNQKVTDAGLANFVGCRNLTYLHMHDAPISDAGLAFFKDCKNLTSLALSGKDVSDLGLVHFAGCRNLTTLDLAGLQLTDAGMAHFRECKELTSLKLAWTNVSDRGLAHFKDCENLTSLLLFEMPVTDTGLAHFQNCQNLKSLSLFSRHLSDAGLVHFRNCKNLEGLQLSGMRAVSDAGLANFQNCRNLSILDLQNSGVSDAGLAHFQDCRNLASINLCNTEISDAGLERLTNYTKLSHVAIMRTRVTEAGVKTLSAALAECKVDWEETVQD